MRIRREQLLAPASSWTQLWVVLGLTGFAISQPVLSVLGGEPSVFAFRSVTGVQLLLFVLALALVPPALIWGIGGLVGLVDRRAGWLVHLACCGGLVGLTTVQVLEYGMDVESRAVLLGLGAVTGLGFVYAYASSQVVATWAQLTAILPLVAVLLFFTGSPSGELLRSGSAVADQDADVPSVVFVVLDEFPTKSLLAEDGEIDAERFPNLAAFADDATWYRNHTTVSPSTSSAVPALLTGLDPGYPTGPPLWTRHPDNLFSLLAPTHELNVHESPTLLCGVQECEATRGSPDLTGLLGDTTELWGQRVTPGAGDPPTRDDFQEELAPRGDPDEINRAWRNGEAQPEELAAPVRLAAFIDSLEQRGVPTLDFIHLLLPHSPFHFAASGLQYQVPVDPDTYPYAPDNDAGSWMASLSQYRHLQQARYTDALLGEILTRLHDTGRYDESLVIVVADHGASFEPDTNFREVRPESVDSVAFSPLLVKEPGQLEGRIDDTNVLSIDVLPLVADVLGIDIPWETDGVVPGRRGEAKYIHDYRDFDRENHGVIEFTAEERPSAADRWLGDLPPDGRGLPELLGTAGIGEYVGVEVEELDPVPGGTASIALFQALAEPGNALPLGVASGSLVTGDEEGRILLAVDGTVVTGSPLFTFQGNPGSFAIPVPPRLLGAENEITLLRVVDGEVRELQVS